MIVKNLTIDQAEIILSLFVAQNADKKVSEFVGNYDGSLKICELVRERNDNGTYLCTDPWNFFGFRYQKFHVWVFRSNGRCGWEPFDIMKYISLEDTV